MPPEEYKGNKSGENNNDAQVRLEHSKNALLRFFGEYNQGKLVLDIIIRISLTTLVSYPGEKDLQVCNL